MRLADNQMLLTISENGKLLEIKVGNKDEALFRCCPDNILADIQSKINRYAYENNLKNDKCWGNKGCAHNRTGLCNECE